MINYSFLREVYHFINLIVYFVFGKIIMKTLIAFFQINYLNF